MAGISADKSNPKANLEFSFKTGGVNILYQTL
jgi:hypothetical protein